MQFQGKCVSYSGLSLLHQSQNTWSRLHLLNMVSSHIEILQKYK